MSNTIMNAKDAVYGGLAECFITIGSRRYNFMSLTEFKAIWKHKIAEIAILGKVGKGHKVVGGEGTWSGKAHFNQSVFREMANTYQKTGYMPYFEIQVSNEDPTSTVGRQTVILRDCLCEEITLAKFTAGEEALDEDLSGTFESFDLPEKFKELDGFVTN